MMLFVGSSVEEFLDDDDIDRLRLPNDVCRRRQREGQERRTFARNMANPTIPIRIGFIENMAAGISDSVPKADFLPPLSSGSCFPQGSLIRFRHHSRSRDSGRVLERYRRTSSVVAMKTSR